MSSDKFVVNVEGAVCKDNRWLMITRSREETHAGGTLSMVGGTVDHKDPTDHTLEETLRREFAEEVGIELESQMTYVESKTFLSDSGQWTIDIVFLCNHKSGIPTAMDPNEVESVHWMTPDEIYAHDATPPWIEQSIKRAVSIKNIVR